MKISIVIPCYNVGQYLTRCIESVLSQTYSHLEVILIDDGSTDSTATISQSFVALDTRVQYFYQENLGVSVARNLGIEKASGAKIMFLDADDYITSTMVADLVLASFFSLIVISSSSFLIRSLLSLVSCSIRSIL